MTLPTTIEARTCCVPPVTATMTVEDAERVARVFKALGDPTRVRLLSLIAAGSGGEACICDLTEPVGLSQGTVSHHMKLLTEAGLVGFIGGLRVYNKWTNGDQDVNKEILGYGGAMIFLIVVPEFVTAFFA